MEQSSIISNKLEELPSEMHQEIFSYLYLDEFKRLSKTCKKFHQNSKEYLNQTLKQREKQREKLQKILMNKKGSYKFNKLQTLAFMNEFNEFKIELRKRAIEIQKKSIKKNEPQYSIQFKLISSYETALKCGHIIIVKYLMEEIGMGIEHVDFQKDDDYSDDSDSDKFEQTILNLAAQSGNIDLIRYIIETYDYPLNRKAVFTNILHAACISGNVKAYQYICEQIKEKLGDKEFEEMILEIDGSNSDNSILDIAANYGHLDLVKAIFNTFDELSKKSEKLKNAINPLTLYVVRQTLQGAHIRDIQKKVLFYKIVEKGNHLEVLKYLLEEKEFNLTIPKMKGQIVYDVNSEGEEIVEEDTDFSSEEEDIIDYKLILEDSNINEGIKREMIGYLESKYGNNNNILKK